MQWINLVVCLLYYEWCTGEMNQPLRLRCVCCYTFMQWINLVECLLDYEWLSGEMNLPLRLRSVRWYYAMNKLCCVFVGLWNDVRARWICPYVYGMFADIMQWINLVVCLLDYEWCTGEINLPLRLRCVRWYYAMNEPCGVFVDIYIVHWIDPVECLLIYILSNK